MTFSLIETSLRLICMDSKLVFLEVRAFYGHILFHHYLLPI